MNRYKRDKSRRESGKRAIKFKRKTREKTVHGREKTEVQTGKQIEKMLWKKWHSIRGKIRRGILDGDAIPIMIQKDCEIEDQEMQNRIDNSQKDFNFFY